MQRARVSPGLTQAFAGSGIFEYGGADLLRVVHSPLSGPLRDGQGTAVASLDDIHTPVEKFAETHKPRSEEAPDAERLPGEFVTDELEQHTKRFIEEAKGLAQRRRDAEAKESLGPPPPSQRSRRR